MTQYLTAVSTFILCLYVLCCFVFNELIDWLMAID